MSIVDELEKLDQLRAKGTLTEEEFAQAKAKLLSLPRQASVDEARSLLTEQLVELRLQNQLAQLDREWDIERRRHQIVGTYGRIYSPSLGMGLSIAIAGSLFGLFWMYTAYNFPVMINAVSPIPWQFPIVNNAIFAIGVLIVLGSVLRGISLAAKALSYSQAFRAYRKKREQANGSLTTNPK